MKNLRARGGRRGKDSHPVDLAPGRGHKEGLKKYPAQGGCGEFPLPARATCSRVDGKKGVCVHKRALKEPPSVFTAEFPSEPQRRHRVQAAGGCRDTKPFSRRASRARVTSVDALWDTHTQRGKIESVTERGLWHGCCPHAFWGAPSTGSWQPSCFAVSRTDELWPGSCKRCDLPHHPSAIPVSSGAHLAP